MLTSKQLLKILKEEHGVNSSKEKNNTYQITVGVVVDTDDPLENGRLRVFCPSLNDDPRKLHHLPWAVYISPFIGLISNNQFARGTGKDDENTDGAVAYGMWAIPEQGSKVLVGCIDGDVRRRFFLGGIPEHQEMHTLFHGRFKWEGDGEPDGPLSSKDSPIEPAYTNAKKAFDDKNDSREWKTRQAEYQAVANPKGLGNPNDSKDTYEDEQYEHISEQETDDWVKPIVGAHGYDWSGNKAVGSHKSSRVYGFCTPGFHAWSMDDRAFNSRVRIRSATGHQIIFDDTNERIYLSTNEGNNWIELDSNGNIDIYSKRRISVHAEKDINFSTDETFRVKAKKGIHMYAGDNEGQEPLESIPADGQIRLHSTDDMHILSEKNLRTKVEENYYKEIKGDAHLLVGGSWNHSVNLDVNISSNQHILAHTGNSKIKINPGNIEATSNTIVLDTSSSLNLQCSSNVIQVGSSSNKLYASSKNYFIDGSTFSSLTRIYDELEQLGSPPIDVTTPPTTSSVSPETFVTFESETEFSLWTNRVPEHEPWPRVMKQDSDDPINEENDGYKNNVDWIDQYDNETSPDGLEPIGVIEGDETNDRGPLWRR
jgi:hypothetical protein